MDYKVQNIKDIFFLSTKANFESAEFDTSKTPDYVSGGGSRYWYTDEGVYRESDHWGTGIATCKWYLDGKECFCRDWSVEHLSKPTVGFCKWEDFEPANDVCMIFDRKDDCKTRVAKLVPFTMGDVLDGLTYEGTTYRAYHTGYNWYFCREL